MRRSTFLGGAACAFAASALPLSALAAESDITLVTATGTIYGTLMLPNRSGAVPVALIIAGSGPTDRDGNSPMLKSDTYLLLAQALAAKGIASVRYDKRGIAASQAAGSSEEQLRFDMFVDDAAAWQRKLRADKRFSRILIAGHSEGSLIGMISARRGPVDAFVSLEGAGRRASVVLLEQLKRQLPADMYAQTVTVVDALQNGHTVPLPPSWPPAMQGLFRPSVQPYIISWFKYDPAAEVAKLKLPTTIVQGTADVQITVADANALKAAAPKAHLVLINGMNHLLRDYSNTSSMQAVLQGYEDTTLPIDVKVVNALRAAAA